MYSNFNIIFRKQTVETLYAASDFGLHSLPMSHKKDARLIWVKQPEAYTSSSSSIHYEMDMDFGMYDIFDKMILKVGLNPIENVRKTSCESINISIDNDCSCLVQILFKRG